MKNHNQPHLIGQTNTLREWRGVDGVKDWTEKDAAILRYWELQSESAARKIVSQETKPDWSYVKHVVTWLALIGFVAWLIIYKPH